MSSKNCRVITVAAATRWVPPTAIAMSETSFLCSEREESAADDAAALAICTLFVFSEPPSL